MRRWLRKLVAPFKDRFEAGTLPRVTWNGRPRAEAAAAADASTGPPEASDYSTLTLKLSVSRSTQTPAEEEQ
jgi:hypothetical protein